MAYGNPNCRTKKELKERVERGERVTVFEPGPGIGAVPANGTAAVEGPHYPEPHRWYAQVIIKNGRVVKVR
jgi:hypothetical protein